MKLAMILGRKQGDAIKSRLQNIKDNLDIDVFEDIPEYVYNVSRRNTIYDRILVISRQVNPTSLSQLYESWSSYSKSTNVIMLSQKGTDENKAQMFMSVFRTPVACAMLVESTTVNIVAESVLRPTSELNRDYGFKNFLNVEVDDGVSVATDSVVSAGTQAPVQNVVQPAQNMTSPMQQAPMYQQQMQPTAPQQKSAKPQKKKHGFLSGIFGSRGPVTSEGRPRVAGVSQRGTSPPQQVDQYPVQEFDEQQDQYDGQFQDIAEDFVSDEVTDEGAYDSWTSSEEEATLVEESQVDTEHAQQCAPQHEPMIAGQQNYASHGQNHHVSQPTSSSIGPVEYEETLLDMSAQEDDFSPEGVIEDVDFGADGLVADHKSESGVVSAQGSVAQADEDLGGVSVLNEEAQYRRQKEAPRVVTKTVREPVIMSGGGSSGLKGVLSGRLHKVIVVTGDRGTGITSTALNIAQTLAKKINVLYFDCDIDNHGLLNYIDYNMFTNYESTQMSGVKLCKTAKAFDRCAINWDDNLSLLSSDFSCDCSVAELSNTSQVVAERAMDFGVVVVDCPIDKLSCITDLILTGNCVVCVEGSKRGFMNMLCRLEASDLPSRYKRNLVSRGSMFVTKCAQSLDLKKLLGYIKAVYQPDDVDWLDMPVVPFNGKLNDSILGKILEG